MIQAKPLERPTLFESLAQQLEDWILSGDVSPGAKLPSEESIAQQFAVSRPIVREALARLRERGLVETVNGSGTFVRQPQPERLAEALLRHLHFAGTGSTALTNLFEARVAIEAAAARLAAERATDEDKREERAKFDAMRRAKRSPSDWAAADLAFHLAVAVASHNPFLATLLSPLVEVIHHGIF